ncbi:GNAT family N-acetyltransferase [Actinokineospora sp.]|uniref:GNAT family N-acetyltransferase n=1 Tax=Actinokineospora sp. TaxID=1872133 RepID=UPI0040382776
MTVVRYGDVRRFWAVAGALFERDVVRHTVALTAMGRLLTAPSEHDIDLELFTVHHGDLLVGAGFRTPPWPLVVGALPPEVHGEVIEFLVAEGIEVSGVAGPRDVADDFTVAWTAATGDVVDHTIGQRLYRLGELAPPTVGGEFKLGTADDITLVGAWWDAFAVEALHPQGGDALPGETQVRQALDFGKCVGIWCDATGRPVAQATASPPLTGMSRIGPVYTPPEFRGRGYGSAATAAAARWALDHGARDVLLFTDLSNPVSNSIYQRIGFRPVLDAVEYGFAARHTLVV